MMVKWFSIMLLVNSARPVDDWLRTLIQSWSPPIPLSLLKQICSNLTFSMGHCIMDIIL